MTNLAAVCAKIILAAHCHVWHAGDYMPTWYMPSAEILWDKNWRPSLGKSPCLQFKADAVTWWDGATLHIRHLSKSEGLTIENSAWCYTAIIHSMNLHGVTINMDEQPLFLKASNRLIQNGTFNRVAFLSK